MESKKDIRKRVLEKRNCIPDKEWEDKSRLICEKVVTHPFFLQADAIYCYVDYRREVGTADIIEQAWMSGKKVASPKVLGDEMEFYYIQSFEDLSEGYKGIFEPKQTNLAHDENVLVQGVIDCFYYNDDGEIILVDYKTDLVKDGDVLIERYRNQLDYYKLSLEIITGHKVKSCIIYSFALGKAIEV